MMRRIFKPKIVKVPNPPSEWCDYDGARQLANRLHFYWKGQGYPEAKFWIQKIPGRRAMYEIRSNLVDGVPT